MDGGQWTSASRSQYNLRDAVARVTVQVNTNLAQNVDCKIKIINLVRIKNAIDNFCFMLNAGVSQVMVCDLYSTG